MPPPQKNWHWQSSVLTCLVDFLCISLSAWLSSPLSGFTSVPPFNQLPKLLHYLVNQIHEYQKHQDALLHPVTFFPSQASMLPWQFWPTILCAAEDLLHQLSLRKSSDYWQMTSSNNGSRSSWWSSVEFMRVAAECLSWSCFFFIFRPFWLHWMNIA